MFLKCGCSSLRIPRDGTLYSAGNTAQMKKETGSHLNIYAPASASIGFPEYELPRGGTIDISAKRARVSFSEYLSRVRLSATRHFLKFRSDPGRPKLARPE